MRGGRGDEDGVAPPEMPPEGARLRMPVLGGTGLFRSMRRAGSRRPISGSGPVFANSSRALGSAESGRSRDDAGVATRKYVGEVTAAGAGQDLAASEMVQERRQGIEIEAHGVKKRGWGN